jgi:hypothetical protein
MTLHDELERLVERWRALGTRVVSDQETIYQYCADELAALLRSDIPGHTDLMVTPESLDEWLEINPLLEPEPKLPLMARREWMPDGAVVGLRWVDGSWSFYGAAHTRGPTGRWYRIADTDEHGLPVIPREPGMPPNAKYRWRMKDGWWNYCQSYCPEEGLEWQRIEDFNEEQS